jgi:CubicO group peptidase (beta-lactamase class C family)
VGCGNLKGPHASNYRDTQNTYGLIASRGTILGAPNFNQGEIVRRRTRAGATCLITLLCLARVAVQGDQATPARRDVSPVLEQLVQKYNVPGMVAAVIEGDQIRLAGAAGVRRAGGTDKLEFTDTMHVGSCTKAMTATLCAMLVEEGKLSWTTTIAQALPELKGDIHASYHAVTLEQLLTHRAGLSADVTAGQVWGILRNFQGTPVTARRQFVKDVLARPPVHEPGSDFLYSNAGYSTAGHIIETLTGTQWEELISRRLFEPLEMTTAGFGPPGKMGTVDQPRGHSAGGLPFEPGPIADNPPSIGPSGTVHCSIEDWSKFVALHLRGAQRDARLLKADTFARLHAAAAGPGDSYAMGWALAERPWGGGTVLTHAGSNSLWYAVTWLAPKRNFAVMVMCNQGGDNAAKATDDACGALIQEYLKGKR